MTKITENTDELSFHRLTSTSSMLLIPLFQRAYVWGPKQLERMLREIEAITSGKETTRFLGSVIAVTRVVNPSQPTPHEIVDGQQRLTTMYLFMLAAVHVVARAGNDDYARGLINTYLIVEWAQQLPSNTKLQPSIADRAQFVAIFKKVWSAGTLSDWLPVKAKLPQHVGSDSGPLTRQFDRIRDHLQKKLDNEGFDALTAMVDAVRNSMTFVFILLKDPGSATTVFEGLNDPGVPISVGDLVKNEVFSRIGYNEEKARALHDAKWEPLRNRFGDAFNEYFFPFGVVHKHTTTQNEMFGDLRKRWTNWEPEEIIADLEGYAVPFLVLHGKIPADPVYGPDVGTLVRNLIALNRPTSVYPFLMQLLNHFANKKISKAEVMACFQAIESFLVRRALCGIEPTGLLGLFRTMWANLDGHPTAKKVEDIIFKRMTIEWPSDIRVTEAIRNRPLYDAAISKFVIAEFDRSLGMDHPEGNMTIEHVMPKSYADSWKSVMTPAQHAKLKNIWANLVPCSEAMNYTLDQSAYSSKRAFFEKSMYLSTRKLAQEFDAWGESQMMQRSTELSTWAIGRWPRPSAEPTS